VQKNCGDAFFLLTPNHRSGINKNIAVIIAASRFRKTIVTNAAAMFMFDMDTIA
jgi:hypothetical protein